MRHELIHLLIGTARCNTSVKRMKFAYNVWTHHLSGKTDHEKTINTMSPPTAPSPFDSMGDLLPQMPARNLSFLIVVIPSPNKAFLFKKTIHSSLCYPLCLVSWWSFLFHSSTKSFFNPFHPYLALFGFLQRAQGSVIPSPLCAVSGITHQGSRTNRCRCMKDSSASQRAGIHTGVTLVVTAM